MTTRMTLGIALLASTTTLALAQPGGGGGGRDGGRQGGPPPSPEQFVERMMQRDANGDGKLSRDELPGPFADRMFESNDANGDGFLDKDELMKVAESFGQRGAGRQGFTPGQPAGAPDAGPASYDDGMKLAGRALRQLRRSSFADDSRVNDLRQIQMLQDGLLAAKGHIAEVEMAKQAKEKYGDDEVRYHSDMRLSLVQALFESLAMEDAVVRGDAAEAKKSLENLMQVQKDAHAAFKPEDEDEGDAKEAPIPEPARVRPGARPDGQG